MLTKTPRRLQTNAHQHSVFVIGHVTCNTSTCERNNIPYTVRVVTEKKVAHVEHSLLIQSPKLELRRICTAYALSIPSLQLCTETETGSKPLTKSYCKIGRASCRERV